MDEKNIFKGQVFQSSSESTVGQSPSDAQSSEPASVDQSVPPGSGLQPPSVEEPTLGPPPAEVRGSGFSMSNIIKFLIGLFAIVLLVFVLFSFVIPNINKKEQKVELSYWDVSDNLEIKTVLSDFEKQNPNIKVNYVKQDIKDYKDRIVARSKNGTGPDIFRFHNTWVLQLSDILLPIPSDVMTKDNFNKTFYSVTKHDLIKNGAIYGIPLDIDTLSLFVNSQMFKDASLSAPTNWNDFITTARSLTLKDQNGKIKTAGASLGTFDNITHAPDVVSLLFVQDSVNLDDISQTKGRVSDALGFYTAFALSDGSVWDATLDASILAFSKGNLAMYFGYYRDIPTIKSANPNLAFDVVSVPHLAGQNQTISSYYPVGVSIKSKHQKEALLFLKYLSQKGLVDNSKGQAKDAASSYFSGETFDNGVNSQMNSHLLNATNSILAGGSPDSAADNLILGFSQVLNQFAPKK